MMPRPCGTGGPGRRGGLKPAGGHGRGGVEETVMKAWMRAAVAAGTVWLLATGMLVGCDDSSSSVPPEVLAESNKPKPNTPKVPTTQELVSGPRSRTVLVPLPLTMELPVGWRQMKDVPSSQLWQGYTPSGEVQLQLNSRRPMTQQELDRLMTGAKKEMAEKPQQILKVDLRQQGNVKILERQSVGEPRPLTVYDSNNVPHTSTESIFTWTVSVLVPMNDEFQVYELNFFGLTKSQYDKDKDFLNSILSTLQYAGDTSGSGVGPTTGLSPSGLPANGSGAGAPSLPSSPSSPATLP
jgi:hypothetical protein